MQLIIWWRVSSFAFLPAAVEGQNVVDLHLQADHAQSALIQRGVCSFTHMIFKNLVANVSSSEFDGPPSSRVERTKWQKCLWGQQEREAGTPIPTSVEKEFFTPHLEKQQQRSRLKYRMVYFSRGILQSLRFKGPVISWGFWKISLHLHTQGWEGDTQRESILMSFVTLLLCFLSLPHLSELNFS